MKRYTRIAFAGTLMMAASCAIRPPAPPGFSFALMGDQQYNAAEEALFPTLLDSINAKDVKFIVHVGDFKAGSNSPCTDQLYRRRLDEFNQSRIPLILIPGDNDWMDCRRSSNGRSDPLERLDKIREIFFADSRSLGRSPLKLARQSDIHSSDKVMSRYRENAMWHQSGVVFATFNIQGGNDNLGYDRASDREHAERTRANIEWFKFAAQEAKKEGMVALAIFLQGNPGFEEPVADVAKSGYVEFLRYFEREAALLGKPVLFAHGDTHHFRVDRPYLSPLDKRPVANVTRVETHGSPFINWVQISVDPRNPDQMFSIRSGEFVPTTQSD